MGLGGRGGSEVISTSADHAVLLASIQARTSDPRVPLHEIGDRQSPAGCKAFAGRIVVRRLERKLALKASNG